MNSARNGVKAIHLGLLDTADLLLTVLQLFPLLAGALNLGFETSLQEHKVSELHALAPRLRKPAHPDQTVLGLDSQELLQRVIDQSETSAEGSRNSERNEQQENHA